MKKGIMLINLGTPEEPTARSVRAHLSKFLADSRVVSMPKWLWLPILHGIILRVRPKKSAKLYQKIWTKEGSPLLVYTKKQAEQLQADLPDYLVRYAMSYSHPTIAEVTGEMLTAGVDELLFIPLYPQFSVTTIGAVYDEVSRVMMQQQNIPTIHFVHAFYQSRTYIEALARRIKDKLQGQRYDMIVFSYHSVPAAYVAKGDPYPKQCHETTEQVMDLVGAYPHIQTYQSKFGPHEWLTPATDQTLKTLPQKNRKKVLVITPGFVSDCLETIEELGEEDKNYFMENGGEVFDYIRPFNDDEDFIKILDEIVAENER